MATISELLRDVPLLNVDVQGFRPILDKILVEEIPVEESRIATPGGMKLERHGNFVKKSNRGRVLAVGDGVPMGGILMPMPYKPGQVVQCSEYGREHIYLKAEDEFDKTAPKRYLIRVADTHGEVL